MGSAKHSMANTNHPRSAQNIFVRRAEANMTSQPAGRVGQDKGAVRRARTPTSQSAPTKNGLRPQAPNNNRAQTPPTHPPKRKTVHLTLWVKPIVKAELQRIAEEEGVSVSATGGALLERVLQQHIDMQYSALLQPIIANEIRKEMRSMSTRLAWLLVRVAFDAGQTRNLATNQPVEKPGDRCPATSPVEHGRFVEESDQHAASCHHPGILRRHPGKQARIGRKYRSFRPAWPPAPTPPMPTQQALQVLPRRNH